MTSVTKKRFQRKSKAIRKKLERPKDKKGDAAARARAKSALNNFINTSTAFNNSNVMRLPLNRVARKVSNKFARNQIRAIRKMKKGFRVPGAQLTRKGARALWYNHGAVSS